MKQNNVNMLFKSLALYFLILSNLISDILCKVPLSSTPLINSTVPVTVVEGEVEVPKRNACYAINNHYKVKSTEDFFKDLVKPADEKVTEYKFLFNSAGSGKDILTNKIMPVVNRVKTTPPLVAEDLFKGFEAIVGKIKTDAKKLKIPVTVNVADFEKFMIELDGPGCALSFNDIVDNLVVYLNCTLDDLKNEVKKVKGNVPIDATLINALNDVKADKNKVLEAIYERVNTAAKKAVVTTMSKLLAIAPTSKPTSLKELFEALNSYGSQTVSKNATTNVEYSIVDAAIADSIPFDIKAADIGNDKIFLSQFIDTKNVLAKDVFVAICEKCTDVNDRLKAILSKLKTDFTKTVEDALSKCVSDKTVSKDKFNEIFTIAFPVAVIDSDIGDRKIKLCWLPDNTDPGQQFNNFSYWLESNNHLQSKYFNDKETAINEFFKVFEDKNKLAGYKKQLEEELKNLKSKTSTPENNSNGPENFTSGMKLITIICIVIGGVFGGLFIIFAGYFGWKFYSKKDKI